MAVAFVAESAWVYGTGAITPGVPTGTQAGDYVIIHLVSKYDDAVLGGAPAGWDDLGTAVNSGRPTGNDNGNLRTRCFGRVWQTGDVMPSLAPTPNNVSGAMAVAYRSTTGFYSVEATVAADNATGTPLASNTPSIDIASGDHVHVAMHLNSDVATFNGAMTITMSGATNTQTAGLDGTTSLGTDMRNRTRRAEVTAGSAGSISASQALAGTTTNSVGTFHFVRIRESGPPAQTMTAIGIATAEAFGSPTASDPDAAGVHGVSSAEGTSANPSAAIHANTEVGDVVYAWIGSNSSSATFTGVPTGWTLVEAVDAISDCTFWLYSKTMESGDLGTSPSWTFSTSTSTWSIDLVTTQGWTLDVQAQASYAAAISHNTASVTPTNDDEAVLHFFGIDKSTAGMSWDHLFTSEHLNNTTPPMMRLIAHKQLVGGAGVAYQESVELGSSQELGVVSLAMAPASTGPSTINAAPSSIASGEAFPGVAGGNLFGSPVSMGTSDLIEPESRNHNPVYQDTNGNLYKVVEKEVDINPTMLKSTDGGDTWSVVSTTTSMSDVEGFWTLQEGSVIWVAQTQNGATINLRPFRTSDNASPDTWGTLEQVDTGLTGGSGAPQWVSANRLSNGDVWFFYSNEAYRKRNANGTYGARVSTNPGQFAMPVTGESDLTYIVSSTATAVQYHTLTAAGTLTGPTTVYTGHYGGSTTYGNHSTPVYFDNAGEENIAFIFTKDDGTPWLALITNGSLTTTQLGTAALSEDAGAATSGGVECDLVVDGTTLHMVWTEDVSGNLVYRTRTVDGTLSTPITLQDPDATTPPSTGWTTNWYPYLNIIQRGNAKHLVYSFDKGDHANSMAHLFYAEYALASPGGPSISFTPTSTQHPAAVSLTSASTLTAAAPTVTRPAAVSLTSASTLTAAATVTRPAAVSLTSASTLTAAAATVTRPAAVSLTSASTLTTAAATVTRPAAVSLTSASTLTAAAPTVTRPAAVSLTSASTLTAAATGLATVVASVSLTSTSTLQASAFRVMAGSVTFATVSTLSVAGPLVSKPGAVILAGTSALTVALPTQTRVAAVLLTAISSLTAAAFRGVASAVNLTGTSSLSVGTPTQARPAAVSLTAASSLATSAFRELVVAVALSSASTLTVLVEGGVSGQVAFTSTSVLNISSPTRVVVGGVLLTSTSVLTSGAVKISPSSVALTSTSVLTSGAVKIRPSSVSLLGVSTLTLTAEGGVTATLILSSQSLLSVGAPTRIRPAVVSLAGQSFLVVSAPTRDVPVGVSLSAEGTLTVASPQRELFGGVLLVSTSVLSAAGTVPAKADISMSTWAFIRNNETLARMRLNPTWAKMRDNGTNAVIRPVWKVTQ